jgi:hypothetical protein
VIAKIAGIYKHITKRSIQFHKKFVSLSEKGTEAILTAFNDKT